MSKKIVSIALIISLLFSFCSMSALAVKEKTTPGADEIAGALEEDLSGVKKSFSLIGSLSKSLMKNLKPYVEDVVLTPENIEKAKNAASKIMAKLIDKITNPSKPGDPSEPSNPSEPSDPTKPSEPSDPSKPSDPTTPDVPGKDTISVEQLKAFLKKYIFVRVDDVDAAAMEAVKNSEISYELVDGNGGTVYISVDIEKNPEIFNFSVFRSVVDGLYAAQGEELLKNGNGETDYAMSYEHIAGELALHAIVFAVTDGIINVTGTKNETIVKMYNKAALAELNYDEKRVPSEVMSILGVLIMDLFRFSLLKLFGVL